MSVDQRSSRGEPFPFQDQQPMQRCTESALGELFLLDLLNDEDFVRLPGWHERQTETLERVTGGFKLLRDAFARDFWPIHLILTAQHGRIHDWCFKGPFE